MSQPPAISLLVKTASDLKDTQGRATQIAYLRQVLNEPLRYILQGTYHPNVHWLVKGPFNYVPAEPTMDVDSKFYREYKKLYMFCRGGGAESLPEAKRHRLFTQLLEAVHPDDAKMVIAMVEKRMEYPGISYDLVAEAFPGILPDLQASNEVPEVVELVTETPTDLPSDLDNMTQEELADFFKKKFGQAIPEPVKKERAAHTNKGKGWFHDGVTDFLATPEEAEENGWIKGRLRKKGYKG